jgi:hypothetical protein
VAFAEDVQLRTARGESVIDPTPIVSITSIPLGVVSVVSRPFPYEAQSFAQLLASIEGLALLIMGVRSLPNMLKHRVRLLREPYLSYSLAFTLGFIVAFSTVSNLGIVARQRAQVLPFLLVVIVAFSPVSKRNQPDSTSRVVEGRHADEQSGTKPASPAMPSSARTVFDPEHR